jgi:hypothetical protein
LWQGSAGMPSFSSIAAIRCNSRVLRRMCLNVSGYLAPSGPLPPANSHRPSYPNVRPSRSANTTFAYGFHALATTPTSPFAAEVSGCCGNRTMISPFFTSGQTVSAHGLYLAFVALILFLAPGLVRLVLPSPATLDWWTRLLALPLLNLGILCIGVGRAGSRSLIKTDRRSASRCLAGARCAGRLRACPNDCPRRWGYRFGFGRSNFVGLGRPRTARLLRTCQGVFELNVVGAHPHHPRQRRPRIGPVAH